MASRRAATKAAPASPAAPLLNAVFLLAAIAYGMWLLVVRGRVSWPPNDFLNSTFTITGCLAMVGPIVLLRRQSAEGTGVGDLIWLTGGMLVWIFDLAALIRGDLSGHSWATPLAVTPMGLTILAVLVSGWRAHSGDRNWSWTNVTGWVLGLFWIGMGLAALIPTRVLAAAAR